MKAQELSRKYAQAVFSLAIEKWLTALKTVQSELAGRAAVRERLQDTARPFSEKQKELDPLIPTDSSQDIRNFLYTLLREGDLGLLDEVIAELEWMSRGGSQVQVARVTTAMALSESEMEQFRQKLRARYGQNLEFNFIVDPAILGGAVVQVGDQVMDGSVATRLEAMSNALGIKS